MSSVDRRRFLALLGSSAALASTHIPLAAQPPSEDFDFIFLTDTHIQPELDASKGCGMAFHEMRRVKADFAIQGGDHVFDALAVTKQRSISLYDLYDQTQQDLSLKVYHAIGNHDVLGLTP